MNQVFVISDPHFYHSNIIKYCHRPFSSVDEMNEVLIKNWNATVKKDDIVYCLGDFVLGNKELCKEITARLNGRKVLVQGNHDRWNKKFYEDCGFEHFSRFPIVYDGHIILSHAPLQMTDCEFNGRKVYNIYGHIHNNLAEGGDTTNSYCVSVENIGYKPVLISEVIKTIDNIADTMERIREEGYLQ